MVVLSSSWVGRSVMGVSEGCSEEREVVGCIEVSETEGSAESWAGVRSEVVGVGCGWDRVLGGPSTESKYCCIWFMASSRGVSVLRKVSLIRADPLFSPNCERFF